MPNPSGDKTQEQGNRRHLRMFAAAPPDRTLTSRRHGDEIGDEIIRTIIDNTLEGLPQKKRRKIEKAVQVADDFMLKHHPEEECQEIEKKTSFADEQTSVASWVFKLGSDGRSLGEKRPKPTRTTVSQQTTTVPSHVLLRSSPQQTAAQQSSFGDSTRAAKRSLTSTKTAPPIDPEGFDAGLSRYITAYHTLPINGPLADQQKPESWCAGYRCGAALANSVLQHARTERKQPVSIPPLPEEVVNDLAQRDVTLSAQHKRQIEEAYKKALTHYSEYNGAISQAASIVKDLTHANASEERENFQTLLETFGCHLTPGGGMAASCTPNYVKRDLFERVLSENGCTGLVASLFNNSYPKTILPGLGRIFPRTLENTEENRQRFQYFIADVDKARGLPSLMTYDKVDDCIDRIRDLYQITFIGDGLSLAFDRDVLVQALLNDALGWLEDRDLAVLLGVESINELLRKFHPTLDLDEIAQLRRLQGLIATKKRAQNISWDIRSCNTAESCITEIHNIYSFTTDSSTDYDSMLKQIKSLFEYAKFTDSEKRKLTKSDLKKIIPLNYHEIMQQILKDKASAPSSFFASRQEATPPRAAEAEIAPIP